MGIFSNDEYPSYEELNFYKNKMKKYEQMLLKIKEKTRKYDAEPGDTIIANPIQDCYDIFSFINDEFKDFDNISNVGFSKEDADKINKEIKESLKQYEELSNDQR